MTNQYINSLKRRIKAAQDRYDAAVKRGESEAYLAISRHKLDELKDALQREEGKAL